MSKLKKEIKKNSLVVQKKTTSSSLGRVPTGIEGFDDLVEGGFPEKSSIVVAGGPGCGKTIFSMQYLINGALKYGDKGMYVTFEQRAEALRDQAKQFGWDLDNLEKKGLLTLIAIPLEKITVKMIEEIKKMVKEKQIKRLVIDSLSTLVINAPIYTSPSELSVKEVVGENIIFSPPIIGDYIVKRFIYQFIENLRDLNCTSLLITEASQGGEFITRDTLSEFVCDGVILINFESLGGNFSRNLIIRKMRHTKNDEDVHPLEISPKGIIIHSLE